ncbi:hypothetical protein [Streptomyces sp. NPDC014733]|uniref:hypothetical protein n=1 Tax=Streptomyces sp. NPDC014733 TaxID=3364885 RepID=UPI0036FF5919
MWTTTAQRTTRTPAGKSRTARRTLAALIALTAAGTALAGCGGAEQKVGAAPPGKQDAFEQRADTIVRDWPKVEPVSGHKEALLPLAGADRPGVSARKVTVTVGHGACDAKYGAHVRESEKLVVVSGWSRKKDDKKMCTAQLATDKVTLDLKKPLGHRTLVDAATGKPLASHR